MRSAEPACCDLVLLQANHSAYKMRISGFGQRRDSVLLQAHHSAHGICISTL